MFLFKGDPKSERAIMCLHDVKLHVLCIQIAMCLQILEVFEFHILYIIPMNILPSEVEGSFMP